MGDEREREREGKEEESIKKTAKGKSLLDYRVRKEKSMQGKFLPFSHSFAKLSCFLPPHSVFRAQA